MKAKKKDQSPFLYTPGTRPANAPKPNILGAQTKTTASFSDIQHTHQNNDTVLYFENLIKRASCMSASHIYIEPEDTVLRIRYRTSAGLSEEITPISQTSFDIKELLTALCGCNEDQSNLEELRTLKVRLHAEHYDLSIMPTRTAWGLSLTVGLDKTIRVAPMLDELGIPQFALKQLRDILSAKSGFVLLNGPHSIGKQLSRLAMLQDLNTPYRKIISLEETPKVQIPRVSHVPLYNSSHRDGNIANYILRQAPDICSTDRLVHGETLIPLVNATLNNTMLLATSEAPNAIDALEQLLSLGCDKHIVAQSLKGIFTQQELAKVCPDCKKVYHLSKTEKHWIGQNFPGKPIVEGSFTMGEGCTVCSNTGLFGYCNVYELIRSSEELSEAIIEGSRSSLTTAISLRHNFQSLKQRAFSLANEGLVPLQQVMLT